MPTTTSKLSDVSSSLDWGTDLLLRYLRDAQSPALRAAMARALVDYAAGEKTKETHVTKALLTALTTETNDLVQATIARELANISTCRLRRMRQQDRVRNVA